MKETIESPMTANKKKRAAVSLLAFFVVFILLFQSVAVNVRAAENRVADPATNGSWNTYPGFDDSTRNVGRIWTDKTVATDKIDVQSPTGETITVENKDSDFLVALSAMSSTATITGVKKEHVPLDIVLVLDTSGSMGQPLSTVGGKYTEVYAKDLDTSKNYFYKSGSSYTALTYYKPPTGNPYWAHRDGSGWQKVTPKTSAQDRQNTQFYKYSNPTKLEALKETVDTFIDKTSEKNQEITETEQKQRISVVSYAFDANTANGLTVCEGKNVEALKKSVNELASGGATEANKGLSNAQTELQNKGRANAKKIVLFFTDGEPNTNNGFMADVANKAIGIAKTLKATAGTGAMNAQIYTIGMFERANAEDTEDKFNAYMHAVSSNYPNATSYTPKASLGDRAEGDFYKTASDTDELEQVFQTIFENITNQAGLSPTHLEQGSDAHRGVCYLYR